MQKSPLPAALIDLCFFRPQVDLRHINQSEGSLQVENGIDMSEFYTNVEWDIMKVPASYDNEFDESSPEPYPRITFNITMRRKTLFYTVNLIIPCVGISFLTLLVFYLPSDSGEKLTLASSILVSLTVFFLLLSEMIPASSLAVPLIGKYLLFTMLLITLCICATVGVLDIHFRSPSTHLMSPWVRAVFIDFLPTILCMKRVSSHDLAQDLAGKKLMASRDCLFAVCNPLHKQRYSADLFDCAVALSFIIAMALRVEATYW